MKITELFSEIYGWLKTLSLPIPVLISDDYVFSANLASVTEPVISIVAESSSMALLGRDVAKCAEKIVISLAVLGQLDDQHDVAGYIDLCSVLHRAAIGLKFEASDGVALCGQVDYSPVYSLEHYEQMRAFYGILSMTFTVIHD